ncbi:hypothetical protein FBUS_00769 [Fasciolopsis buskii]|uniref:SAYSvFN domain-containing protein n=1 Tax=Fasciolopsis buskii TaxID=27845 RepID=A0A8E0RWE0_9TREM|nr:hypothetical protein FBUS_00769 [Fasciolopsis buski]
MGSGERMSFSTLKAKLESYRIANPVTVNTEILNDPLERLPQEGAANRSTKLIQKTNVSVSESHETPPPTSFGRIIYSWRFQGILTVILWILAVRLEFGAVFFVIAALYWMWTWGTEKYARPRNPDEQVIQATFFYDPSPIPQIRVS